MMRKAKRLSATVLAVVALLTPARTWAQENLRSVTRNAEAEFRRHVNEYQDRLRALNFSRRPSPPARKGMNDTIVNAYRSHLAAMTRVRNESDAEISHMEGVSPAAKNNAIRALGRVYATEVRTLREHEEQSMQRLHEAERR